MAVMRINDFHATKDKAAALRGFLTSVMDIVERSSGCRRCELLADPGDQAHLMIVEVWDIIEAHRAAAAEVPREKFIEIQALLAEPPTGHYYEKIR